MAMTFLHLPPDGIIIVAGAVFRHHFRRVEPGGNGLLTEAGFVEREL